MRISDWSSDVCSSDLFMARATTIRTRKGQLLIAEGSTADDVYLIVGGRLQISMIAANGRETILRDMGPGRLVGEMSAISTMPRPPSVPAVEDRSLGMLSGAGFRTFMHEEPGAGYWMAVQLPARVRNLPEKPRDTAPLPAS